jgi:hypothetical protein
MSAAGYGFDDPVKALPRYFFWTVILTAIIVPISIVMFINTSFSNDVGNFLKDNDAAAITLHEALVNYQSALPSAPNPADRAEQNARDNQNRSARSALPNFQALLAPSLIQQLAQFARVSRQIFYDSQILNLFIFNSASGSKPAWAAACKTKLDQCEDYRNRIELNVRAGDQPLPDCKEADPQKYAQKCKFPSLVDEGFSKLATYQDIRAFAKQTLQANLIIYGAITAYVLPVFYALLGACAFALRNIIPHSITQQATTQQSGITNYIISYSNRARLIIALIAGTVVGLFNNFTQGVSVSPLAIAFLVGYAVEVFFSFLDAFVHTFERVRDPGARAPAG